MLLCRIIFICSVLPTVVKCSFWHTGYLLPINGIHNSGKNKKTVQQHQQQQQQQCDSIHNEVNDSNEGEGLVFEGKFRSQSDLIIPITVAARSIPLSSDSDDLFNFFLNPKNRDMAIKGGNNPTERILPTPELYNEWTTQSRIVHSKPPDGISNCQHEEILAVYSKVPIVPGLSLRAVSYTGCKTMIQPQNNLPYYEFTLLNESYEPVGRKSMTWIFDRVTGKNNRGNNENKESSSSSSSSSSTDETVIRKKKEVVSYKTGDGDENKNKSANSNRKTYCLSRVTLEPFPKEGGCRICYYGHVRLTLSKRFLHMLPLPKRIVQSKVNKSIRRQLERECNISINKLSQALNEHIRII